MLLNPLPFTDAHPRVIDRRPVYRAQFAKHRLGLRAAILAAAADPASELFHRDSRDGVLYRRSGASHRSAFWAGFDSIVRPELPARSHLKGLPTSDAEVCYRAGQDFGRAVLRARKSVTSVTDAGGTAP